MRRFYRSKRKDYSLVNLLDRESEVTISHDEVIFFAAWKNGNN
jgi:hypothetical protein